MRNKVRVRKLCDMLGMLGGVRFETSTRIIIGQGSTENHNASPLVHSATVLSSFNDRNQELNNGKGVAESFEKELGFLHGCSSNSSTNTTMEEEECRSSLGLKTEPSLFVGTSKDCDCGGRTGGYLFIFLKFIFAQIVMICTHT